jgi:hypothetical protein
MNERLITSSGEAVDPRAVRAREEVSTLSAILPGGNDPVISGSDSPRLVLVRYILLQIKRVLRNDEQRSHR